MKSEPQVAGLKVDLDQLRQQRDVLYGICMNGRGHNLTVKELASMTLLIDMIDGMISTTAHNDSMLENLTKNLQKFHD